MLKICMVECCNDEDAGSIGCFYVVDALRRRGFSVDVLRKTSTGYDVELLSVHHCSNFPMAASMPKLATIRIIGGHPMQNNPRPLIFHADAVFCGEAEVEIVKAMIHLENGGSVDDFPSIGSGWIIGKNHKYGDSLPSPHYEKNIPETNRAHLNFEGTRSCSWYIEAARGCPFRCAYCELGNTSPYRRHSWDHVRHLVDSVDPKVTRKINLFAPDEASLPFYDEFLELINSKKMYTSFSSMHFKTIMNTSHKFRANHLFRLGLDGMTESTRFRVGKKITDVDVIKFFLEKTSEGYVNFKLFMIFGYPWDTEDDFHCFSSMMESVFRLPVLKNIHLRVKWTPFIPQPCTPLGTSSAPYRYDILEKILTWHRSVKSPIGNPGFYVHSDGIMNEKRHSYECKLTSGDEYVLGG